MPVKRGISVGFVVNKQVNKLLKTVKFSIGLTTFVHAAIYHENALETRLSAYFQHIFSLLRVSWAHRKAEIPAQSANEVTRLSR